MAVKLLVDGIELLLYNIISLSISNTNNLNQQDIENNLTLKQYNILKIQLIYT